MYDRTNENKKSQKTRRYEQITKKKYGAKSKFLKEVNF